MVALLWSCPTLRPKQMQQDKFQATSNLFTLKMKMLHNVLKSQDSDCDFSQFDGFLTPTMHFTVEKFQAKKHNPFCSCLCKKKKCNIQLTTLLLSLFTNLQIYVFSRCFYQVTLHIHHDIHFISLWTSWD